MMRVCSSAYSLVLGHHHRRVVMVVLEAAVCSTLQQQPHRVYLTSATGVVQRRVPTVWLAVDITAALYQRKQKFNPDVIQKRTQNRDRKWLNRHIYAGGEGRRAVGAWCERGYKAQNASNFVIQKVEGDNFSLLTTSGYEYFVWILWIFCQTLPFL